MKKVVIVGSASLQEKVQYWKNSWEKKGFFILDYPSPISKEVFLKEYPKVYIDFFKNITATNILFIMNEDKNDIVGYVGAESFSEMCFGVSQKLIYNKNIEIVILKMPDKKVQAYDEIVLWLKLGWISLYKE